MFRVIFIDTRGPAVLSTCADKGACRRAWKTCNNGAAIVDERGEIVETKGGTTDAAERKLKLFAAHLKRQAKLEEPAPPRAALRVASVEEDEEEDEPEDGGDADADEEPEEDEATTYTRVDTIEQVDAMVARDDARAAARERGTAPSAADPDDNALGMDTARAGGKCESCGVPVPFPSDFCGPCDQRRAAPALDVTHAIAPATGAVVQGDDTERLAPPAAAVTCESKGCDHAPGIARSNVRPEWRPFCGACRVIIRQRGRAFPGGEAAVMEHLRAGTLPPVDAKRAALGAKGGRNSRASQSSSRPTRPRKPTPAPAPKPRRAASPAATLAAGLETARACAEVVARLGGIGPARELAAIVEEHGGAEAVLVTLAAVAELGGMAA